MTLTDEIFEEINNLEPIDFDMEMKTDLIPDFIQRILSYTFISFEGKINLMKKFGIYYMKYDFFRNFTNGCWFIFIDREYKGIFPDEKTAAYEAHRRFPNGNIFLVPMYPEVR